MSHRHVWNKQQDNGLWFYFKQIWQRSSWLDCDWLHIKMDAWLDGSLSNICHKAKEPPRYIRAELKARHEGLKKSSDTEDKCQTATSRWAKRDRGKKTLKWKKRKMK